METATVVSTPVTWLPEDDTLLKCALEEGASLEALAKGAVPFSRSFTLQEVHDRWHGMLYDQVISAQASEHLFLDEADKRKEINESHRKRKVGTLRKRYHEFVKRRRNEFLSPVDLGFLNEPSIHSCTASGVGFHEQETLHNAPQVGNAVLGDSMPNPFHLQVTNSDMPHQPFPQDLMNIAANYPGSDAGDAFHAEGPDLQRFPIVDSPFPVQGSLSSADVYTMGFSSPLPSMPLWKTIEDVDMPLHVVSCDTQNVQILSSGNGGSSSKRLGGQIGENFIHSASISDGGFGDLPEALFDFSNDDMVIVDMDRKERVDKSCAVNTLSVVPTDMNAIENLKLGDKAIFVANAVISSEPEARSFNSCAVSGEGKPVSQIKVEMPSSPVPNRNSPEKGILYCALNTEDPEIPCNDDIFLLIHPPSSTATSAKTLSKDPVSAKERNNTQGLNSVKKREEMVQSSKTSFMFGSYMLPEAGQVHTGGGPTVKAELVDSYEDSALRYKAVADLTQSKLAQTSLASASVGNVDKDVKKVDSRAIEAPILSESPMQIEEVGVDTTLHETEENLLKSDQEGSGSENGDLQFSDVESMILDMDLASYDDDLHFTQRVSKHQQEDSKREIIRMEQCARASLQRSMITKGALAVLFGRRSKHYIRKTEVILGRSTEETVVDIDLGKEGRHNKISRRQALVKMETDGSFTLRNLSKNPMLVNGTEVGSGESTVLGSSCLIEIRGISFAFEINQKYVDSFRQNTKRRQVANF